MAHPGGVPAEVGSDCPRDDLACIAKQDAQGAVQDPDLGVQASLGMEDISGSPQFLQDVHQIEDQIGVQFSVDSKLKGPRAVSQGTEVILISRLETTTGDRRIWPKCMN